MAEIVEFKARPRSDRLADRLPAEGAQILFFTGVRYERADSVVEQPTRPAGGGKSSNGRGRRRRA
jgi:hypothetical protein